MLSCVMLLLPNRHYLLLLLMMQVFVWRSCGYHSYSKALGRSILLLFVSRI